MQVIADLHIHSKYSRATSSKMEIKEITRFAEIKGLNLLGTGDFTHPKWFRELMKNLREVPETSLYVPLEESTGKPRSSVRYMITGEVSTIFTYEDSVKKIHHLILTPSLETADQINDRLARYGDLGVDGRPTLNMTAPQLVEEVMEVSSYNMVIPAHAWTPWFSLFGAFSGFDRIEDCYQDATRHISAIETGLSSDPPMNWRLSSLDRFTLISNSDSHSPWPWRIGREANVFDLKRFTYWDVVEAIKRKDPKHFKYTIETDPAYGKYHWTGHRACNVSLSPSEAIKLGGICPVCRRALTKGVEQRVEELADRPRGYKPRGVPGYRHLLPLSEIISVVVGASSLSQKRVWRTYNALISRFGDEYKVLIEAPYEEMAEVVDPRVAKTVIQVREERIKIIPGYDGVYGQLVLPENDLHPDKMKEVESHPKPEAKRPKQRTLADFM